MTQDRKTTLWIKLVLIASMIFFGFISLPFLISQSPPWATNQALTQPSCKELNKELAEQEWKRARIENDYPVLMAMAKNFRLIGLKSSEVFRVLGEPDSKDMKNGTIYGCFYYLEKPTDSAHALFINFSGPKVKSAEIGRFTDPEFTAAEDRTN